jgi:hypothetical protein
VTTTATFPDRALFCLAHRAHSAVRGQFYNQLAGARVDALLTDKVALGAYLVTRT